MRLDLDTSNAITGFASGLGPIQLSTGLKLKFPFPCLDLAGDDLRTCSYEPTELTLWRDILRMNYRILMIKYLRLALPSSYYLPRPSLSG